MTVAVDVEFKRDIFLDDPPSLQYDSRSDFKMDYGALDSSEEERDENDDNMRDSTSIIYIYRDFS